MEPNATTPPPGFYWVRWPDAKAGMFGDFTRWTTCEVDERGDIYVPGLDAAVTSSGAEFGPRLDPPPAG